MSTSTKKPTEPFVKDSRVISKPGAIIRVRELTLTESGMRAITTGSAGIRQGAVEDAGPPSPLPKWIPA